MIIFCRGAALVMHGRPAGAALDGGPRRPSRGSRRALAARSRRVDVPGCPRRKRSSRTGRGCSLGPSTGYPNLCLSIHAFVWSLWVCGWSSTRVSATSQRETIGCALPSSSNWPRPGVRRDEVDFVLCTHLHFDHVGWYTILENLTWVPTFPCGSRPVRVTRVGALARPSTTVTLIPSSIAGS